MPRRPKVKRRKVKRYRYRGLLAKLPVATAEQVVASAGEGGPELIARARAENAARLEGVLIDLLLNLGMPPPDPAAVNDPNYWFIAFRRLAGRHVLAARRLSVPGIAGRPRRDEGAQAAVNAAIDAKQPGQTIIGICEDHATRMLRYAGKDARAGDVDKLTEQLRKGYYAQKRGNRRPA